MQMPGYTGVQLLLDSLNSTVLLISYPLFILLQYAVKSKNIPIFCQKSLAFSFSSKFAHERHLFEGDEWNDGAHQQREGPDSWGQATAEEGKHLASLKIVLISNILSFWNVWVDYMLKVYISTINWYSGHCLTGLYILLKFDFKQGVYCIYFEQSMKLV